MIFDQPKREITFNPNCAEIFSHLIHAGGGVIYDPPLSSVIAVIKGQTKKQMIKFCKKKLTLNSFFNGCYRYLTVKPPKIVIHTNASGRCIFYSSNLKFYEKASICICDKI